MRWTKIQFCCSAWFCSSSILCLKYFPLNSGFFWLRIVKSFQLFHESCGWVKTSRFLLKILSVNFSSYPKVEFLSYLTVGKFIRNKCRYHLIIRFFVLWSFGEWSFVTLVLNTIKYQIIATISSLLSALRISFV